MGRGGVVGETRQEPQYLLRSGRCPGTRGAKRTAGSSRLGREVTVALVGTGTSEEVFAQGSDVQGEGAAFHTPAVAVTRKADQPAFSLAAVVRYI